MWKSSYRQRQRKRSSLRMLLAYTCLAVLVLLVLSACNARGNQKDTQAKRVTPITTMSSVVNLNANAQLKPTNLGHVELLWEANKSRLIARLKMSGLLADTRYYADIERGTCKQVGMVMYRLNELESDAFGNLENNADFRNVDSSMPPTGWSFHVRNEYLHRQMTPEIACAEINNPLLSPSGVQQASLDLQAPQPVNGNVKLHLLTDELTIEVQASGLDRQKTYFAHVHLGNCGGQGKAIYNADQLKVDTNGNGTSTTVVHGVGTIPSSGWYVNLHEKATSSPLANDVVACGDVNLQLQQKNN